uniref:palmitoyl-CoA hydrolase n=1 Tax=Sander lucioperca TaxID=283035 RepID=A0A8C9Y8U7_SANLU
MLLLFFLRETIEKLFFVEKKVVEKAQIFYFSESNTLLQVKVLHSKCYLSKVKVIIMQNGSFQNSLTCLCMCKYHFNVHPGTEVTVIDLYDSWASLEPMWKQVQGFKKAFDSIVQKAPDGVHLVCFSQGGLICRALLSMAPDHNVHTFVSLSSPLAGQYGDTEYLRKVFPDCTKKLVFHFCYNRVGQKVSICNYWNDPHHRPRYLQGNSFLAMLNGDRPHNDMKGSGMHYCHYVLYVCGRAVEICIVERKSCISPFHLLSMERKLPAYQEACSACRSTSQSAGTTFINQRTDCKSLQ